MSPDIDSTRRQIGELGAMARQCEDMDRRILSMAEQRLEQINGQISEARVDALTGDDAAKDRYADLVEERGRLNQVIATARAALGTA